MGYLINQTLGGLLVRALCVRAGILLLINQRILPREPESLWASFWYKLNVLKIEFYTFTSDILTTRVIIYFIDAMDSLGNYIYIFIDYNPLLRILGGEIHRCRM